MMNKYKLIIFSLVFSFNFGCGDSTAKRNPAEQKKQEAKINTFLISSQITISKIDNTLQYNEERVKLDKNLRAFSGSTRIAVRKRGALLDDNKILTTLTVYTKTDYTNDTYVPPENPVYVALFDGEKKELISATLLGTHLSVISVVQLDDSVIEIAAFPRTVSLEQPTSEIKDFVVKLKGDVITIE